MLHAMSSADKITGCRSSYGHRKGNFAMVNVTCHMKFRLRAAAIGAPKVHATSVNGLTRCGRNAVERADFVRDGTSTGVVRNFDSTHRIFPNIV
jgi:hypothetical protein